MFSLLSPLKPSRNTINFPLVLQKDISEMVSIIVINYNNAPDTMACLRALENQTYKCFKVVLIDNGSFDNSVLEIDDFLKGSRLSMITRFVGLGINRGFAGGNSEGLKYVTSPYVALLNSDTVPDREWLGSLVTSIETHPDTGICASKLIVRDTEIIDSAGDGFSDALKGFKMGEGQSSSNFNNQEYIFGACAGAALYRRKMLEEIGFFDENFFLIHEDTDLNFRAQLAGWKVLYVPNAIVHHKVRSSIGVMSDLAIYHSLRNKELVRIKNIPSGIFLRCLPEIILEELLEFFYFAIKHNRFPLFVKAKKDAIKMFPRMWKKRKIIMKTIQVDNRYLLGLMTPIWQKDFFKTKLKKFLYG